MVIYIYDKRPCINYSIRPHAITELQSKPTSCHYSKKKHFSPGGPRPSGRSSTNGIITGKYKYLYQNVRLKKLNRQKIIDGYGFALGDGASCRVVVVLSCLDTVYNYF